MLLSFLMQYLGVPSDKMSPFVSTEISWAQLGLQLTLRTVIAACNILALCVI